MVWEGPINVEGVSETHIHWMVVLVDLADRKGNLGVEYVRKMGGVRCMEEERKGARQRRYVVVSRGGLLPIDVTEEKCMCSQKYAARKGTISLQQLMQLVDRSTVCSPLCMKRQLFLLRRD